MRRAVLAALISLPTVAQAQTWTRAQGEGYVDLTVMGLSGDELYDLEFERQPLPSTYSEIILSIYAEVGVIDRWLTITLKSELLRRNALSDQGATLGLGDTTIGLWSGLITDPIRLTIGAQFGFPTGDSAPSAGPDDDAQAHEIARSLPTGDGEWDVEPRVHLGWSYAGESWPLSHYLKAWIGYAIRTNGFHDQFTYWLELGTKIPVVVLDRFWWWVRFYGVESLKGSNAQEVEPAGNGLGDLVTYTTLAFGFHAEIYDGFGVLLGVDLGLRASNIISSIPVRGGLYYEF